MAEIELSAKERQAFKARAHALDPVVRLGAQGLTPAVLREIDRALAAHGLIKVRVPGDEREAREAMFGEIASTLNAARVQAIGKLLVLYRPLPEPEPSARHDLREPAPRTKARRKAQPVAGKRPAPRRSARRSGPR